MVGRLVHTLRFLEVDWSVQATVLLYTRRLSWMMVVLDGREDPPLWAPARPLQWNKIRKHR